MRFSHNQTSNIHFEDKICVFLHDLPTHRRQLALLGLLYSLSELLDGFFHLCNFFLIPAYLFFVFGFGLVELVL